MAMKLASPVAFLTLAFLRSALAMTVTRLPGRSATDRLAAKRVPDESAPNVTDVALQGFVAEEERSREEIEEKLQELSESILRMETAFPSTHLRFKPLIEPGVDVGLVADDIPAASLNASLGNRAPTPWRQYYDRPACYDARKKDLSGDYFMWCAHNTSTVYSEKYKFGYMKTPKAASTAFYAYFMSQFPDSREIGPLEIPKDAYLFTFVRDPFEQKLAGYAEVELKNSENRTYGATQKTLFQNVSRKIDHGRERFRTFLDDIEFQRFDIHDLRKPSHARSQIAGIMCSHMVDFVGHLDNVAIDWDRIQEEAKLPMTLRTRAVPTVHEGEKSQYLIDEHLPLNDSLQKRLCNMYAADFACLGYQQKCAL